MSEPVPSGSTPPPPPPPQGPPGRGRGLPIIPRHEGGGAEEIQPGVQNIMIEGGDRAEHHQNGGGGGGANGHNNGNREERHERGNGDANGNGGDGHNGNANGGDVAGPSSGPRVGRPGPTNEERRVRRMDEFDVVLTRPGADSAKKGTTGRVITLFTNYFRMRQRPGWQLNHYRVDFDPEEESNKEKKKMIRQVASRLPKYIFDGHSMFTAQVIADENLNLATVKEIGEHRVDTHITIKHVGDLDPVDPMYFQFYNIVLRTCQENLNLTLLGRHYYDSELNIPIHSARLDMWPGFVTVLRQHEAQLLMCVESIHKVIRMDSVLLYLRQRRQELTQGRGAVDMEEMKAIVREEVVGTIVMTMYNKKTFRIDDVAWNEKPTDTFDQKGVPITYIDYYKQKYNMTVTSPNQPLLVSNPKKRDIHRGQIHPAKLIPEFCNMTGLTPVMRQNFQLMREMSQHLFQPPTQKSGTVRSFVERIRNTPEVRSKLREWGLDIVPEHVEVPSRVLPKEIIQFMDARGNRGCTFEADDKADFTMAFRNCRMMTSVPLRTWVMLVPQIDAPGTDNLLRTMNTVSRPLGFEIQRPSDVVRIQGNNIRAYVNAITEVMEHYGKDMQLIFVVLPNNKLDTYAAVKKRCYIDYGVPSQCFVSRNLQNKGLMSIATKVVVQMNAKLGGEPWNLNIPLKNMMIVGYDVHHGGAGSKSPSIGAMTATTNSTYGQFYSTISYYTGRDELADTMGASIGKCLNAYRRVNKGALPSRIIFYRDGVGEGQLGYVHRVELEGIKNMAKQMYGKAGLPEPKFTFIVVTKRINTRLFLPCGGGVFNNPGHGTVVDDIITLPERWDFYLIAHSVRQGTVSPTSYNVIYDNSGLDSDRIQRLTYKLCHLYYNWSGAVSVPAPCQYAHKLAYLTGTALKREGHEALHHSLYYL